MVETGAAALLAVALRRIAECHPRPAYFEQTELDDWPRDLSDSLISLDILSKAPDLESVICPGCEMQCLRPLISRRKPACAIPIAIVACESRDDTGMVRIPPDALVRWRSDLVSVASWVARQLGTEGFSDRIIENKVSLGHSRRAHCVQTYQLVVDRDVNLVIDQTVLPLRTVMVHGDGVLAIDLPEQSILSAVISPADVVKHASDGSLCFALDHQNCSVLCDCNGKFGTEADYELLSILATARQDDRVQGRRSNNYAWVPTSTIANRIDRSENAVQKRAEALRDRIKKRAPDLMGLLESQSWAGYRLHPDAQILSVREIRSTKGRS